MKFSTKAIHVGQEPEAEFGAIIPPIYQTSTFIQSSPGKFKGYDYTRAGNPNFSKLEEVLASLENAKYGTLFSSGLGAITALASIHKKDDKVIAINDLYGGTFRLFTKVFKKFGLNFELTNMQDLTEVKSALAKKPKMVIIESPTNPLLKIVDIEKITKLAKQYNVLSVVDNTFASPYFQKPITLGADIVLHSATKYIGGHSDVIGGIIITNKKLVKEKMDFARLAIGLNPSPFDAWLTLRGVKTLALRMEKHQQNAMAVAKFLAKHSKVSKVYYPGLASHKNYDIAKKQMSGFSGIVSAEFKLSIQKTAKLISSLSIFSLAESLGGVESLVDYPASMTHASIPKKEREKIGLSDGLVRFSVGIEDEADLISDLKKAI